MKAANNNTILALASVGVSPIVATFVDVLLDDATVLLRAGVATAADFAGFASCGSGLLGFDAAGFFATGAATFSAATATGGSVRAGATAGATLFTAAGGA